MQGYFLTIKERSVDWWKRTGYGQLVQIEGNQRIEEFNLLDKVIIEEVSKWSKFPAWLVIILTTIFAWTISLSLSTDQNKPAPFFTTIMVCGTK